MVYDYIRQFLGSQNFALITTNMPEITILRNVVGSKGIFVILADNTKSHLWTAGQLASINSQVMRVSANGISSNDTLVIVITENTERDRGLSTGEFPLWLADAESGKLYIYENQPSDFYGLRAGIETAAYDAAYKGTAYTSAPYGAEGSVNAASRTRSAGRFKNIPVITIVLIALNLLYFIVLATQGSTTDASFMTHMGGNYGPYIFKDFEIWRLFTSMFMHFGISHLISNMVYLGIVGYSLENLIGRWKYLLIYMISGIGGGLISAAYYYLTDSNTLSVGASGAIYGLVGVTCYIMIRNFRRMRSTNLFLRIGIMIIFIFYSSFLSPGVDGAAHIGGFVFGLITSIFILRRKS